MRIIFVRHAVTDANKTLTFSTPLTEVSKDGYKVLDISKEKLKKYNIKKVYTSEYVRAQQSARYLGYKDFIVDKRINEIDVGDFRGKKYDYVKNNFSKEYQDISKAPIDFKYLNGESRLDVIKRVQSFMDDVSKEDGDILCVSHGIAIRSSLFWLINDYSAFEYFWINNGSLTVIRVEDKEKVIECVNLIWNLSI